ncbi:MAG TPA: dTMP kinase [Chromatiaceae bacterium]|nr:dTMP kinase [Chromatiaceae bacterium]
MSSAPRPLFITLEGIEGAGKGSSTAFIEAWLRQHDIDVVLTREPGGTELGEALRAMLLGFKHVDMAADTELLLMFAARAQHLHQVIRPALNTGSWVLCDRFTDASYAYQGGGRGLDAGRIQALEELVQQGLKPDLTLLLDLPVEVGLERARQRSAADRFESEQQAFFERVRTAYLEIAEREPERVKRIDASAPLETVQARIARALEEALNVTRRGAR